MRKDFLDNAVESARTDHHSYGDLVVESAKIQSEFDKLKAKLQSVNQLNGEAADRVNELNGVDNNGKPEENQGGSKVYKLEK